MESQPQGFQPKNRSPIRPLILASVVLIVVIASVLVLKFIPLKYEENNYHRDATLTPQQTDTRWFTVPKGYAVSGSYSVSSSNSVELTVNYQSTTTYLSYSVCQEQGISGSFSFKAESRALDDRYYLSLKNPASSGFFGFGAGPTITVSVDFKVSGWTTFL